MGQTIAFAEDKPVSTTCPAHASSALTAYPLPARFQASHVPLDAACTRIHQVPFMDWHPIDELAFPVHVHDGQLLDVRQSAEDEKPRRPPRESPARRSYRGRAS